MNEVDRDTAVPVPRCKQASIEPSDMVAPFGRTRDKPSIAALHVPQGVIVAPSPGDSPFTTPDPILATP